MKPIGLTLKNTRINPYSGRTTGELMIIHLCLTCGRISCNRIAGDDNSHVIICLLEDSTNLDKEIVAKLNNQGIMVLNHQDKEEVLIALYGYNY